MSLFKTKLPLIITKPKKPPVFQQEAFSMRLSRFARNNVLLARNRRCVSANNATGGAACCAAAVGYG
jgi:hypothetical protein